MNMAMNLTLDCPACRRTIQVPGDCLGMRIACPLCNGEFEAALPVARPKMQSTSSVPEALSKPSVPPADIVVQQRNTVPTWLLMVLSLAATAAAMTGVWFAMKAKAPAEAALDWRKIVLPETDATALFPIGDVKWSETVPDGIFHHGKEGTLTAKDVRFLAGWRSFEAKDGADKPFDDLVQPERKRLMNGFTLVKQGPVQFQVGNRKFEGIEWEAARDGETQHGRAIIQVVPPRFRVYFLAVTMPKPEPAVVSKFLNGLVVE